MDAFQQIGIVCMVMVGFACALWMLQRRGLATFRGGAWRMGQVSRGERKLQVIERLQLTPQHAVCLVRIENKTVLIGTAPSSCTLLSAGSLSGAAGFGVQS